MSGLSQLTNRYSGEAFVAGKPIAAAGVVACDRLQTPRLAGTAGAVRRGDRMTTDQN